MGVLVSHGSLMPMVWVNLEWGCEAVHVVNTTAAVNQSECVGSGRDCFGLCGGITILVTVTRRFVR